MAKQLANWSADNPKIALGVAIGVGAITAVGAAYYYKQLEENRPPKKWRRVGDLTDLICYPIKSCGAIRMKELESTVLGLQSGRLRDRVFMVVDQKGEFINARGYPRMLLIQPDVVDDVMTLKANGMQSIEVDIKRLHTLKPISAVVWGDTVKAVDCGEEVAKWISRFILSDDYGLRLMYYPSYAPDRTIKDKGYECYEIKDTGSLHDATSFMLMNEASVTDLNTRLDTPTTPLQFRPNFLVRGPPAYSEDDWQWVRIGKDAVFRNVKPCTRCIFTNIDPETAERNPDGQPLKTLKQYRLMDGFGSSPVMGIHMGVRIPGKITLGDPVYIGNK